MKLSTLLALFTLSCACTATRAPVLRPATQEEERLLLGSRHLDSESGLTDIPADGETEDEYRRRSPRAAVSSPQ